MTPSQFNEMMLIKFDTACETLTQIIEFSGKEWWKKCGAPDEYGAIDMVELAKTAMKKIDPEGRSPWAKRIRACDEPRSYGKNRFDD